MRATDDIVATILADSGRTASAPLAALPAEFAEVAEHYASVYKYPLDYSVSAILAACATAIGNDRRLHAGAYSVTANLYMMIVGNAGINKTTSIVPAFAPINHYQGDLYRQYREEYGEWKSLPKDDRGPEPVLRKIVVNNTTMEALLKALSVNSKGIAIVTDELAGWLKSMNQYRSGGDMEDYLSMWMGLPITKSRITSGDLYVESPLLTIIGTIQPAVLSELSYGKEDNGFLDRFLLVAPDKVVKPYPENVFPDPNIEARYSSFINRLLALGISADEEKLRYTPESWDIVYRWVCQSVDRQNATDDEAERAIRAKMDIYVHRFALILQLMEYAVIGVTEAMKFVGTDAATGATMLADYFFSMAEKVRLRPESERLTQQWKAVFDMLPPDGGHFTTSELLLRTDMEGIPEITAKRWLSKQAKPGGVLVRIKHGVYAAKN